MVLLSQQGMSKRLSDTTGLLGSKVCFERTRSAPVLQLHRAKSRSATVRAGTSHSSRPTQERPRLWRVPLLQLSATRRTNILTMKNIIELMRMRTKTHTTEASPHPCGDKDRWHRNPSLSLRVWINNTDGIIVPYKMENTFVHNNC